MQKLIVIAAIAAVLLLEFSFSSSSNADTEVIESNDDSGVSFSLPDDYGMEDAQMFSDKVESMLKAIAVAEGFYHYVNGQLVKNTNAVPAKANNPCDLKVGNIGFGVFESHGVFNQAGTNGITIFPSEDAGWNRGRHQVVLMLTGKSHVYSLTDSFLDVANKYAEGATEWGINVANALGLSASTTLADFVNS